MVSITATGSNNLNGKTLNSYGIYATTSSITIQTPEGEGTSGENPTIVIGAETDSVATGNRAIGIYAYHSNAAAHNTKVTNENGSTIVYGTGKGEATGYGIVMDVLTDQNSDNIVDISSRKDTLVAGTETAASLQDEQSQLLLTSLEGNNQMASKNAVAVNIAKGASLAMSAEAGTNSIASEKASAMRISNQGSTATLIGKDNSISAVTFAIDALDKAEVFLSAKEGDNTVSSTNSTAISGDTGANISLTATNGDNVAFAGTIDEQGLFGSGLAVKAKSGAQLKFTANNGWNIHHGAIDTREDGTNVAMNGKYNAVYSAAVIDNAGGLQNDQDPNEETSFVGKSVISALYAEGNASISATGDWNIFRTTADPNDTNTLERVLWAYDGADIIVDGGVYISTDSYSISPNSADIAIAAGTAVNLTEGMVNTPVEEGALSKVSVTYDKDSYINGDILAAYAGDVNVSAKEGSSAGMVVEGNILAGNNGSLTLDLGNGGVLTGRADDYGDAATEHTIFFNPAFSSAIYAGGDVNLNIGSGSVWNVTGQSWVTNLSGEGGLINMTGTGEDGSHALHIRNLSGEHTFVMDVDHAVHADSDMLYVDQTAKDSVQTVQFVNMEKLAGMANGEKLRFATVNADNLSFVSGDTGTARTYARDIGINDLGLDIKSEDYSKTDAENVGYNGEKFDENKAGNTTISDYYGEGTNWYLVRNSSADQTSDAGKTVIAMSKVNYSNAVYMDRLNKRIGEARYLTGDDGLWVRLRHDRIGKDDAFRSMNTMFEIGYD